MYHPFTPGHRLVSGVMMGAVLAATVLASAAGGAFASAPASHAAAYHSVTAKLDGHTYQLSMTAPSGRKTVQASRKNAATSANTLSVGSSASTEVVTPNPQVFLVFWGSQWSNDPAGAMPGLQNLFKGLFGADDTWGNILTQYCEGVPAGTTSCGSSGIHITHPSSSPLGGVFMDTGSAAPAQASAAQIGAEAVRAAQHFGATATTDQNAQYVIASPTGTDPDSFRQNSFCGEHDNVSAAGVGDVAFTNLPYVPDLGQGACTTLANPTVLDGYTSTESHEYAETVTDVVPGQGWTAGGSEIGDLCINLDRAETLTTGTFDVQGLWSNADNACVTAPGQTGGGSGVPTAPAGSGAPTGTAPAGSGAPTGTVPTGTAPAGGGSGAATGSGS